MKYSDMLKNKQNECLKAANTVYELAVKETREMTAEEQTAFDASMAEHAGYDAKISAAIENEKKLAVTAVVQTRRTVDTAVSSELHDRQLDSPTRGYEGVSGLGLLAQDVFKQSTGQGTSESFKILSAAGDGLSAGVSTDGGVLLPPAYSTQIMDLVGFTSDSLISECDQLPNLPDGVESMEYPAVNETSRADGARRGGIQGYWKAELTQMSSSKPTLKDVKFSPQQLYVFAFASDKLLKHAPQLATFLANCAADEINFKIGDSIINGTGIGMPRGILTGAVDAPRVRVAKESGQAAASVITTNIEKMYSRIPAAWLKGAKWYINQNVYPSLFSMTKAVGTGGNAVYMPGMNIAGAPFGTLYGLPVVPIEYCASIGTEGDIILANFKKYAIMTRGAVESGMSIHLKFDFNQSCFRFIFEIDGQPWNSSSITPYKGTSQTLAPFVTLADRS